MAVRKLAESTPTTFYSMPVAGVGSLDPKIYRVSLTVERIDAEPLSDDECEEIERVFAALATAAPAAPPASSARSKTGSKGKSTASKTRAAKASSKPQRA